MDVMNQPLHVDRVTRVAVDRRWVVALDTVFDIKACLTVHLEVVVTGITVGAVDDQAGEQWRSADRQEVHRRVVSGYVLRQKAAGSGAYLYADAMRLGFIVQGAGRIGGKRIRECVFICSVSVVYVGTSSR